MACCSEGRVDANSVVVKDVADSDLLEIALTENVQREDLTY
jgi:ParB-like chromosome segregation protein Spo0J